MTTLTASQKIYLTSALAICLIGLFISLLIIPLIAKILSESRQLTTDRQTIDAFYQDWQNLAASQKSYKEFQENLINQKIILGSSQAISFITDTEDFAQKTQNKATITALEKSSAGGQALNQDQTIDFQIALQGRFPNLIKFLIYLENGSYFNNVLSLQVARAPQSGGGEASPANDQVRSVINLSVYQQ